MNFFWVWGSCHWHPARALGSWNVQCKHFVFITSDTMRMHLIRHSYLQYVRRVKKRGVDRCKHFFQQAMWQSLAPTPGRYWNVQCEWLIFTTPDATETGLVHCNYLRYVCRVKKEKEWPTASIFSAGNVVVVGAYTQQILEHSMQTINFHHTGRNRNKLSTQQLSTVCM